MKLTFWILLSYATMLLGADPVPKLLKGPVEDVSGSIRGDDSLTYRLQGRKGRSVNIDLTAQRASWLVVRVFPAKKPEGADVLSNYMSGETKLRGVLPDDGDYILFVGIRRAEARRGGSVSFKLRVAQP